MKQKWKVGSLFAIIIAAAIGIFFIGKNKIDQDSFRQKISDEIVEAYSKKRELDLAVISLNNEEKFKYSEEYLAKGYNLLNENKEEAMEYIEKAIDKFGKDTEFEVKRIALETSITYYIENELYEEIFSCIKIIGQFSVKELAEYSSEIKTLLFPLVNIPGGRAAIIDVFEEIVKSAPKMDTYTMSIYRNFLAMFYAMDGNYSKAIEEYFLTINNTEVRELNTYQIKSKIEIGNIFSDLDKIEIAEDIYRETIDIILELGNIEDMMISYAYINLYEALIYQGKYNEYLEIADEIEKYYDNLDEVSRESTKRLNETFLAAAYINVGQVKEAEKILRSLNDELLLSYIDDDTYISMVYGDYYSGIGKYEEAAEIYENIYKEKYSVMNKRYRKMLAARLIDTYGIIGDEHNQSYYSNILTEIYKQEIGLISEEYINYVIEKCNNEQERVEMAEKQLKIKFFTFVIVVICIYIVVRLSEEKMNGRKDGLSGINNRKTFDDNYLKKFKKSANLNLIIFDIDDFKYVNDTYGHMFGDEVIINVAKEALKAIGKNDEVYRYGGEEFVIINTSKNIEDAINLSETIRKNIENIKWEKDVEITVSMGISKKLANGQVTFENADNNLYRAKRTGKNKVVV